MQNGIVFPAKAVEGAISIVDAVSVHGAGKAVTLAAPVEAGDAVVLSELATEEIGIEKATGNNGVIVGFVHDNPEYDNDPTQAYTKTQAVSADVLRKCGVESAFATIRTVPAKASEAIKPGMYVEFSTDGWKKTASSGTTEADAIALVGQNSDDEIVIGIQ